jgi:enoyl-CoA hydratase
MADEVLYDVRDRIALITLNRPEYANAQNSAMTYALDAAFGRAVDDEQVAVIVLAGAGKHFCGGHDIGTPGRDADQSFDRQAVLWWDHVGKDGADARYAREMEVYLGMCRRWREIPKPSIAMVHGACIAGGLMLARWCGWASRAWSTSRTRGCSGRGWRRRCCSPAGGSARSGPTRRAW